VLPSLPQTSRATNWQRSTTNTGIISAVQPSTAPLVRCEPITVTGWALSSSITYPASDPIVTITVAGIPAQRIISQTAHTVHFLAGPALSPRTGDVVVTTQSGYQTTLRGAFQYQDPSNNYTTDFDSVTLASSPASRPDTNLLGVTWTSVGAVDWNVLRYCDSLPCSSQQEWGPLVGEGGSGNFAMVHAYDTTAAVGVLQASFNANPHGCSDAVASVSLYYHLYTPHPECGGGLTVQAQDSKGTWKTVATATERQAAQSDPWLPLQYSFPNPDDVYGIRVVAEPYAGTALCFYWGVVAVDSITVSKVTTCLKDGCDYLSPWPTVNPTAAPTTQSPTLRPTARPTNTPRPTSTPTIAPTYLLRPALEYVNFACTQRLNGVTATQFRGSSTGASAFLSTAASQMQVSVPSLCCLQVTDAAAADERPWPALIASVAVQAPAQALAFAPSAAAVDLTYQVKLVVNRVIAVGAPSSEGLSSEASAAYNATIQRLRSSISSGAFQTALSAALPPELSAATAQPLQEDSFGTASSRIQMLTSQPTMQPTIRTAAAAKNSAVQWTVASCVVLAVILIVSGGAAYALWKYGCCEFALSYLISDDVSPGMDPARNMATLLQGAADPNENENGEEEAVENPAELSALSEDTVEDDCAMEAPPVPCPLPAPMPMPTAASLPRPASVTQSRHSTPRAAVALTQSRHSTPRAAVALTQSRHSTPRAALALAPCQAPSQASLPRLAPDTLPSRPTDPSAPLQRSLSAVERNEWFAAATQAIEEPYAEYIEAIMDTGDNWEASLASLAYYGSDTELEEPAVDTAAVSTAMLGALSRHTSPRNFQSSATSHATPRNAHLLQPLDRWASCDGYQTSLSSAVPSATAAPTARNNAPLACASSDAHRPLPQFPPQRQSSRRNFGPSLHSASADEVLLKSAQTTFVPAPPRTAGLQANFPHLLNSALRIDTQPQSAPALVHTGTTPASSSSSRHVSPRSLMAPSDYTDLSGAPASAAATARATYARDLARPQLPGRAQSCRIPQSNFSSLPHIASSSTEVLGYEAPRGALASRGPLASVSVDLSYPTPMGSRAPSRPVSGAQQWSTPRNFMSPQQEGPVGASLSRSHSTDLYSSRGVPVPPAIHTTALVPDCLHHKVQTSHASQPQGAGSSMTPKSTASTPTAVVIAQRRSDRLRPPIDVAALGMMQAPTYGESPHSVAGPTPTAAAVQRRVAAIEESLSAKRSPTASSKLERTLSRSNSIGTPRNAYSEQIARTATYDV
jgi:hypothetical protein